MVTAYLKKEPGKNSNWKKGEIKAGGLPIINPVAPLVYSEKVTLGPKSTFDIPWQFEYNFRPGEFLGAVVLFVNGKIQHRNIPQTGVGIPGVNGQGQYSEVEVSPGSGVSSRVQFNTTFPIGTEIAFVGLYGAYNVSGVDEAAIAAHSALLASLQYAIPNVVNASAIPNGGVVCTVVHPGSVNRPLLVSVYKLSGGLWTLANAEVAVTTNLPLTETVVTNVSAGITDFKVVWE